MSYKKVIAVCQSGGVFVKNKDGTLTYNGGEAFAIDLNQQTQLSYFKQEVSEMFNCDEGLMTIKYFLPGNNKTLITIAKDKDLSRMVSFVGDSNTVDVFIFTQETPPQNASDLPVSRSSRTTVSEAVAHDHLPATDADVENNDDDDDNDIRGAADADMENNHDDDDDDDIGGPRLDFGRTSKVSSDGNKHCKAAHHWENVITGIGQRFNSLDDLLEAVGQYSIAHGFAYRFKKYGSHRIIVKCKSEGCYWRICASRLASTPLISIKKMEEHTCRGANLKRCRRSRSWFECVIKEKLKSSPKCRPKDIVDDIQRDFGIELTYKQAWRAKEMAREQLQGSCREAYSQLPLLCKRITEVNPGNIVTLSTNEDSSFHRLFISFHASITGFRQGCRPIFFLDSIPLNSKYQGELFAVASVDGDDGAFPVAFAVVDSETADNWEWFLDELKRALSLTEPVTFVSDFQNGLKESVPKVFGNCYHSYCLRYMAEALNKDLKVQLSQEARRLMVNDFYVAAYATQPEDFERCIRNIKAISREAFDWIVRWEPKFWANAYFKGTRYNFLTSNFAQLISSWVSEAGGLPITRMIDVLRGKMMDLICTRRMESNQWETRLTPSKQEKLEQEIVRAQYLQIQQSQGCMFEVHGDSLHVVDIDNWLCSCKQWQLTGLPCSHAIAVFRSIHRDPYDYCSKYFTLDLYHLTYAESIEPLPSVEESGESEGSQDAITVTPPPSRRSRGRPKLNFVEPEDIGKRQLQCSKCKGLGHNSRSCKRS